MFRHFIFIVFFLAPFSLAASQKNGFVITDPLIPASEIFAGGPPKDGIPAIVTPKFVSAEKSQFLENNAKILGIVIDGVAKAYPIKILNWHEIVNDKIKNKSFVVSYCPLCGTGLIFETIVAGENLTFGVSGLLYNSDVLFYDHQSESLWSQLLTKAISGKFKGSKLKLLASEHTTWERWKNLYPNSLVLSTETGFNRDYTKNPYAGYDKSRTLYFKVSNQAPEIYHPKELVLGLEVNGKYKAYSFVELKKNNKHKFNDLFEGQNFVINWDEKHQTATITNSKGELVPTVQSFWFAWFAFHPETGLYQAK